MDEFICKDRCQETYDMSDIHKWCNICQEGYYDSLADESENERKYVAR